MTSHPARLLRIDSSARTDHTSVSRRLASRYEAHWRQRHPHGQILTRDLAVQTVPHIGDLTIKGYYTDPRDMTPDLLSATALSDELIGELKSATTLLISAPIYNFSIPSSLKAWIDQVVRIGQTFSYQNGQFEGLVQGTNAVLTLAYGAGGYTDAFQAMDHLRPYLVSLLGFIGIAQVDVIMAQATTADEHTVAAEVAAAQKAIDDLFEAEIIDNAVS